MEQERGFDQIEQPAILVENGIVTRANEKTNMLWANLSPGEALAGRLRYIYESDAQNASYMQINGRRVYLSQIACEEGAGYAMSVEEPVQMQRPYEQNRMLMRTQLQKMQFHAMSLTADEQWAKCSLEHRSNICGMMRAIQVLTHRTNSDDLFDELTYQNLSLRRTNVTEVYKAACPMLEEAGTLAHVEISYQMPETLVCAKVDPRALKNALHYMIEHAIRRTLSTPQDEKQVRLALVSLGEYAYIEVFHTGAPLPEWYLQSCLNEIPEDLEHDADQVCMRIINRTFEQFGGFLTYSNYGDGVVMRAGLPTISSEGILYAFREYTDMYGGFSPMKQHLASILPDEAYGQLM